MWGTQTESVGTLLAPNPTSTEQSCFSVSYIGILDYTSFGKKGKIKLKKIDDNENQVIDNCSFVQKALERELQHQLQSRLEDRDTNKGFIARVQARDGEALHRGMDGIVQKPNAMTTRF